MAARLNTICALLSVIICHQAVVPCADALPQGNRKLLRASCAGPIALGSINAYAFPHLGFIGGTCIIKNTALRPFPLNGAAFALAGSQRFVGGLRCPQPLVPAGGELRCGFVAPCQNPVDFHSFTPLFGASTGCQPNPYPIQPVPGFRPPAGAAAQATAAALGQAFGATAAQAQSVAAAQGAAASPAAIADGVCADLFGQAFSNSEAIAKQNGWGDAVAAASSTSTSNGFGGAGSKAVGAAFSRWGGAFARADAAALGGLGGAVAGAQAVGNSQFGPAGAAATSVANPTAGPAFANSGATAIAPNGPAKATAASVGVTSNGPAAARSTALAASGGPGHAGSSSVAAGTVADANSKSVALCGSGPCTADSKSVAQGHLGAHADSKSVAVSQGEGPAVATASSFAGSGK